MARRRLSLLVSRRGVRAASSALRREIRLQTRDATRGRLPRRRHLFVEELELFRLRAELVHETCLVLLGGARGLVSSGDDGVARALSLLESYTALLAAEGEDELARGGARVVAVPAELKGDVKEAGELALVATEGVLGGAGDEVLGVANRVFGAVRESGAGAAVSEGTLERGGSGDEGGVVGVVVGGLVRGAAVEDARGVSLAGRHLGVQERGRGEERLEAVHGRLDRVALHVESVVGQSGVGEVLAHDVRLGGEHGCRHRHLRRGDAGPREVVARADVSRPRPPAVRH